LTSAAFVSFGIVSLKSESGRNILPEKSKELLTPYIAAVMLTVHNPL
jgi:hypothetical protein